MNVEHRHPTPEQAREQIAATQRTPLGSPGDATVHAVATAVFGLSGGVFMASRNLVTGAWSALLAAAFATVWLGVMAWTERAARTVPRRARLWSRIGIFGSLAVALAIAMPWLNYRAQTEPNTWPMVLAASAVVALPSLVAAVVIARGRS